jgi:geranylgeranyl diphosphate synthase type II
MDEAPLRRGKPSVYKKFGESTAILSGDAMLVYAYEYLMKADSKVVLDLLKVLNSCAMRVCEGQQLDMNYEMNGKVTTKDYLNMIELKTAALLAASLQLGAIVGGASPKDSQHLYEFGKQLGVSFQLRDDLLDAFGESEKIGKQRGGDIIQNKKTFLFLEAMRIADKKTKTQLTSLYSAKTKSGKEKIVAVISIFKELGVETITENMIKAFHSKAIQHLEKLDVQPKRKELLKQIAARLLSRES